MKKKDKPPSVEIVDLSHFHKGNGLVATRDIRQGETLFTEQQSHIATSIQMPLRETANTQPFGPVLACQSCFSCLEPASSYFGNGNNALPMDYLWPIPEYSKEFQDILWNTVTNDDTEDKDANDENHDELFLEDAHGRILCENCQALFCCRLCQNSFRTQVLQDCCRYRRALGALLTVALDYDDTKSLADHWEVVLATRLFCASVTEQKGNSILDDNEVKAQKGSCLDKVLEGMCGDPTDLALLQLGIPYPSDNKNGCIFSVEPFYDAVCAALSLNYVLTKEEFSIFSLKFFERLVVVCKRNALDVKTKSSFSHYQDKVREVCCGISNKGGCGDNDSDTPDKEALQYYEQIVKSIGTVVMSNGHITGNVEEVLGQVDCCVLLPLFANINHDCNPSVNVVDGLPSSSSVGCRIDLVAIRDITKGDELSVSYLSPRAFELEEVHRNKRLEMNYLFRCRCSRCSTERQQQQHQ